MLLDLGRRFGHPARYPHGIADERDKLSGCPASGRTGNPRPS